MTQATTDTKPTLTALLLATVANYMKNVFAGWMPGRIQSYEPSLRKATVELLILDVEEMRDGTRRQDPFGIINEVPVVMPGNQDGALIEWTPRTGDKVIVLFGSRATDRHLQSGALEDPQDLRMHDINDALAFPVADFDFSHIRSANPQIKFTGGQVQAGGTNALALNQKLIDLKNAINGWTPVPNDGGAALKTALTSLFATWPGNGTQNLRGG